MAFKTSLFLAACSDTRKAWAASDLLKRANPARQAELKRLLTEGGARQVAELLVNMAHSPYTNVALANNLKEANAMKMASAFLEAFLQPFVDNRDGMLNLDAVKDAMAEWIESSALPKGASESSDIAGISAYVKHQDQRSFLAAPFASPLQFAVLSLQAEEVKG